MPEKYRLLDCGNRLKLEDFGGILLVRPCSQALWNKLEPQWWLTADLEFVRTQQEKGYWRLLPGSKLAKKLNQNNLENLDVLLENQKTKGIKKTQDDQSYFPENLPKTWLIESEDGLLWQVEPNQFGNVGVFTEHWTYASSLRTFFAPQAKILNLFTYTGSNCLILAKEGFRITAVDSSKAAMTAYVKNLELNKISRQGLRLILEDVYKFIAREVRRGSQYQGIMIDAPSYGRGTKKEVFKIEEDLVKLLQQSKKLLTPDGKLVLTLHSPRFTLMGLQILLENIFSTYLVEGQEILQLCASGVYLPSGFLFKVQPKT